MAVFWCCLLRTRKVVYECQLTYPAQRAGASPKMGLKPTLKLWYQHRGLELCLVAKEERGKPSVRLVAAFRCRWEVWSWDESFRAGSP